MKSVKMVRHISILIICMGVFSCSNDREVAEMGDLEIQESYVSATLATMSLPVNLQCDLYIFWKLSNATGYNFKEKITLAGTQSSIRFHNRDLINKDYRFFFVATSAVEPEISVTDLNNNTLDTDDEWHDLLISANKMLLSPDNYSGILDKTGGEILNGGVIDGILTRVVGQIVLDIFRINGNVNTPIDIVSEDITSVLDRVFKVEAVFEGITKGASFGLSKDIHHKVVWLNKYSCMYSFSVGDDLKVSVPQLDNGLDMSSVGTKGSVRIKGIYCLPSTKNMRVKVTFHYYDTTPICGNRDYEKHRPECFEERSLVLNLPQNVPGVDLLSVYPNYFTVNKAGIGNDRIIDLAVGSSISFETEWTR